MRIELSPAYCDVSVTRWQNFVGAEAILEETGETFAAVKTRHERVKETA